VKLAERLRRLNRSDATADAAPAAPWDDLPALPEQPAEGELDRLERSLLGEAGQGLPLKARLERLVAAAAQGRGAPARRAVAIEDLVEGRTVSNEHGAFFLVENDVHLETRHGEVPFSRFHAVVPETVEILTGEPSLAGFDLARAVFLDTETTGLAGGSGTAAFLVGVGYVEADRFRVRQYFMRDYHEEPAMLHQLARDLAGFERVVTFNGKMFDLPLLATRYRLSRAHFPLLEAAHLDLLHPARRLWKLRLDSCRLQSLEVALLGVVRQDDLPGDQIPQVYFDYIRSRHAAVLPRLLEHNRIDILSLAALSLLACQWVEGGHAEDPRDAFSLARVLERASLHDRSSEEYRRALSGEGPLRARALLRLADRAKRSGDHAEALGFWEQAAAEGEPVALRALAVHHEHRSRDLDAALAAVERALSLLEEQEGGAARRAESDFRIRQARLRRKLGRTTR
jgi:hypothetical protein